MAVGMVGVFAGMVAMAAASGGGSDIVKALIAAGVCLGLPMFCVCLTLALVRRSR
jgi:hypothetical protein